MKLEAIKFPKRFEMENVNPLECPVQVVSLQSIQVFGNMGIAINEVDLGRYAGPFAGSVNGQRAVRFESMEAYARLSA